MNVRQAVRSHLSCFCYHSFNCLQLLQDCPSQQISKDFRKHPTLCMLVSSHTLPSPALASCFQVYSSLHIPPPHCLDLCFSICSTAQNAMDQPVLSLLLHRLCCGHILPAKDVWLGDAIAVGGMADNDNRATQFFSCPCVWAAESSPNLHCKWALTHQPLPSYSVRALPWLREFRGAPEEGN